MPGNSGVPVVTTLVCHFTLHARLRVHWHPAFPAPSVLWAGGSFKTWGGIRPREREVMKFSRHCEEQSDEAIHSFFAAQWIASLALAMTESELAV
jgi:hypothetical protein